MREANLKKPRPATARGGIRGVSFPVPLKRWVVQQKKGKDKRGVLSRHIGFIECSNYRRRLKEKCFLSAADIGKVLQRLAKKRLQSSVLVLKLS